MVYGLSRLALRVRGGEETCEGLDEASATEGTRRVLHRASQVWAKWTCAGRAHCCQLRVTQRPPWLWPTEWWLVLECLNAQGRVLPPPRDDGGCRFLDDEGRRCTIYEARPFGCRTYFCENGEGPPLEGLKTHSLLDELTGLNIAVDSSAAPRSIEAWGAGRVA